jgi:threonine/homoserine/homoserine lactone efflux protein
MAEHQEPAMSPELYLALLSFCLVTTITPGPNNMMLLSSGLVFGVRRSLPHMAGVASGVIFMALIVGIGMAWVAHYLPMFHRALHIVSTVYLLWLAWKIARSAGPGEGKAGAQPMRYIQAVAFQWVNPKAWAMVLGAVSTFTRPDHLLADLPLVLACFALVGPPCNLLWIAAGSALKAYLRNPRTVRLVNFGLAGMLVASILPGLTSLA